MRYKVSIRKTDEGYAVWCPGLPGCWSQGETEEEALENIRDAIEAYLETVQELTRDKEGRPIYQCLHHGWNCERCWSQHQGLQEALVKGSPLRIDTGGGCGNLTFWPLLFGLTYYSKFSICGSGIIASVVDS